ncbi:MAG: hypothetical protein K9J06_06155 [Flavobacteriales bacterium]|nr:hypothetical protein [Flavobacteriales bacterium]
MKRSILLFLAAVTSLPGFGQKPLVESPHFTVYMGPQEKRDIGTTVGEFIGGDEDAFYTFFENKKATTYSKYGYDLKRKLTKAIQPTKENGVQKNEFHFEVGDRIYEFFSITDGKAKTNKLLCRTLDKGKLMMNKDATEIFTLKGEAYYKEFKNAFTQIDVSPNGELFLIAVKLPEEKDRFRKFRFMVFDKNFKLIWEKDEKFFINKDLKFKVVNRDWVSAGGGNFFFRMGNTGSHKAFDVGDDGEVVTWGVQDNGRGTDPEDRLETYVFKITKDKTINARVGFKDKRILSYSIGLADNGEVMISGFYNNDMKSKINLIDGAFLSYWNVESGEPTHISFDPFTDEFKMQYWSEKKVKDYEKEKEKGKNRVGMDRYYLDYTIQKEDGGVILLAERFYTYTQRIGKVSIQKYVHDNILIINVDADGNIQWSKQIPKHQDSSNPNSVGYELAYTNDKLYFLYNDNFKNIAPAWDGKKVYMFSGGDNPVVLAVCDMTNGGELTRKQVWTTEKAGGMFETGGKVDQLFADEWIVYIQGGKGTQRLVRVELK